MLDGLEGCGGNIMGLIREGVLNQRRGWGNREREVVGKRVLDRDAGDLGLALMQTSPFFSSLTFGLSLPVLEL